MTDQSFEDYLASLWANVADQEAAQMSELLSSMEAEQDLSVAAMPEDPPESFLAEEPAESFLTEEDLEMIRGYTDDSDDITAHAIQTLLLIAEGKLPILEEQEPETEADITCEEWLRLNQSAMDRIVSRTADLVKGSCYDKEDLMQEARIIVWKGWDNFTEGRRNAYCWLRVLRQMKYICRGVMAEKRNLALTETVDAVRLAHRGFEESHLGGSVTWSSVMKEQTEDGIVLKSDLEAALAGVKPEKREVLSLIALGYTQEEISAMTGKAQSLLSYRYTSGVKAVKKAIA